ncbi:COG1361 S-layer family protein [Halegenticoccus soli]|uniref:COG1361 S-layer family protein n=1 Tax=Halegenticoccus soli TaxID=1985678 RepID=UPI000C6E6FD4|nr:COG1361 S-layer family protein [Halegenticoccus soli]
MQTRTLLVALILVSLVASAPASAVNPRFEAYVPEPTLTPGQESELVVQLTNDAADPADRAETARDVRATVESGDAPVSVTSGTRLLGSIEDGQVREFAVRVSVPSTIEAGTYELPIDVEYVDEDDDERTTRIYATVRVEERAEFVVEGTDASAPVGGSGTVSVTMTNVGDEVATDASVTVSSTDPAIRFGESESASRFVEEWNPGDSRTFEYETTVAGSAEPRSYAVQASVAYDEDGTRKESRPLPFGVTPLPEQTFAVENVESSLRVGQRGAVSGQVTNAGEIAARNAVVVLESPNPNVEVLEPEYAVGDLGPGERANFSFDAEVTDSAEAGPRQLSLRVEYRDDDGENRESDGIDVRADVEPERDEFVVEPVNATFAAGEDGQLELTVTNNRDETLRDVSAKLFVDPPVSASDDEAFVAELGPGESETLVFGVSVDGDALGKVYPVKLDFQYQTEDGETLISDTYQVPVAVTTDDSGGLPLAVVVGIVALVALGGVGYVYGRR